VGPDSPIAQDEIFGPVLAVLAARDLEQAIALANRTRYGLSATLFTRDLSSALAYVERIEVGLVRVNGDTTGVDPHAPFGGMKGSSSGSREQGPAAREFYTEIKTVQIAPG
jgi:aldehyde dehydrogenase (NAD+)